MSLIQFTFVININMAGYVNRLKKKNTPPHYPLLPTTDVLDAITSDEGVVEACDIAAKNNLGNFALHKKVEEKGNNKIGRATAY